MARPGRPERNGAARSFGQLRRFHHGINSDKVFGTHNGRPREDLRFIAAMLSIPHEARYGAVAMTPLKFKDETFRALVDTVEAAARRQPTVLLFEDLHWA